MKDIQFKVGDIVRVKASPMASTLRKVLSVDFDNGIFVGKPMFGTNDHYVENGSAPVVNQVKKVREIVMVS